MISLGFDGVRSIDIDDDGNLVLDSAAGEFRHMSPLIYQQVGTEIVTIEGGFSLDNDLVSFDLGAYDETLPLTIDPVVVYATLLGGEFGGQEDQINDIAVDSTGSAYIATTTNTSDFPVTPGAFQTAITSGVSYDVAVSKLNPSGTALEYSTYIGGDGDDSPLGIAVDPLGAAVVTGVTRSAGFPTTPDATQGGLNGDMDSFLTRLAPSGSSLDYSTFLGGSGADLGADVTVDASGDAYVVGLTGSGDFPATASALQPTMGGGDTDMFVAKVDTDAATLEYATYLGGSGSEAVCLGDNPGGGCDYPAIAAGAAGTVHVVGTTASTDFPTTPGAFQVAPAGGYDAFLSQVGSTGSTLLTSTYLGGAAADVATGVVVDDGTGDVTVVGFTESSDFPTTPEGFQSTFGGSSDAFVARWDAAGAGLDYSTFLGSDGDDRGRAVALDENANAYVTGETSSSGFPTTPNALQPYAGGTDLFVTKLATSGSYLLFSSHLGGTKDEYVSGIAVDADFQVRIGGYSSSVDFPTTPDAFDPTHNAGFDGLVARLNFQSLLSLWKTASLDPAEAGGPITYTLSVVNDGALGDATGVVVIDTLPESVSFVSAAASQGTCALDGDVVTCDLGDLAAEAIATVTIEVTGPIGSEVVTNTATVTANEDDPLTADNTTSTETAVAPADVSVTKTASTLAGVVGQPITYTVTAANAGPATAPDVTLTDPLPTGADLDSVSTTQGACEESGGTLTCALGDIGSGDDAVVTIVVNPTAIGVLTNTATVSTPGADLVPANNTATIDTQVGAADCGRVITRSTRLRAEIGPCAGDGIIIGADGITLDLGGHRVFGFDGPADGNAAGIRLPMRNRVVIRNGTVSEFDAGVFINGGSRNVVSNMTLSDNIGPNLFTSELGDGIAVFHSERNVIIDNLLSNNGWYDGIAILGSGSHRNRIINNTIIDHDLTFGEVGENGGPIGIIISSSLEEDDPLLGQGINFNSIIGNVIRNSSSSGISLLNTPDARVISNVIEDNGFRSIVNNGIGIQPGPGALTPLTRVLVYGNEVHGNAGNGIFVRSQDNQIVNNDAADNALFRIYGDEVDLYDTNEDCDSNEWHNNIWGSGGFFPECVTAGGSGPPAPGGQAAASAAPPTATSEAPVTFRPRPSS